MKITLSGVLVAYAVALSTLLAGMVAVRAVGSPTETTFDTIDVHRINLREPDGTVRLVISDKARFPGIIVRGKETPHASRRDSAGMLFFNDEGTENGGLIFGGVRTNGVARAFGHLSFDQYEQDQVINLEQSEAGGERRAGLSISDRPNKPLDYAALSRLEAAPEGPAKDARIGRLEAAGEFGHPRLFIGKSNNNSELSLRDGQGRKRLVLRVTDTGEATIQFLDQAGKVVRTITPPG